MRKSWFGVVGVALVATAACAEPVAPMSFGVFPDGDSVYTVTGTIQYVRLEGGFYAISTAAGAYDPTNLPDAFRRDDLPVVACVKPIPDAVSVHMGGNIVQVIGIRAR